MKRNQKKLEQYLLADSISEVTSKMNKVIGTLLPHIRSELHSIYREDVVQSCVDLNRSLGENVFCSNMIPSYFFGRPDAQSVLVMLNPGEENWNFRFSKDSDKKFRELKDRKEDGSFESIVHNYIQYYLNFGDIDRDRLDNFDLKQAAFLYEFPDTGVEIPRKFWASDELKKKAKRNVIMQKFQLEMVPYPSRKFQFLFRSKSEAINHFGLIQGHMNRILDAIFAIDRRYVIFCSAKFTTIFKIMSEIGYDVKVCPTVFQQGIIKKRLSVTPVEICHGGTSLKACIANSFPSQALPNAFERMSEYGRFCFDECF